MKRIFYYFILLLVICSFDFISEKDSFVPPGTVKISDKLYYDEVEVSVKYWNEYLNWIKSNYGDSSSQYKEAVPDTTVWMNTDNLGKIRVKGYFSSRDYELYPIVGINHKQAQNYCSWRSERVKQLFEIRKKNKKSEYVPKNFQFRLPSIEEWERVAKAPYSEKTLQAFDKKYKGMARYNYKRENSFGTVPVYSYWENSFKVWQIFGNVAEMTSVDGIAKGGGWIHKEEELLVEKEFPYVQASSWLGFRCVCEIIED